MTYDPEQLRTLAARTLRRASVAAVLYGLLGFSVGAPLGAAAVVAFNGARRLEMVRSRADYDDLVHSEDKREEVMSLLHHVPVGGFALGVIVGAFGFAFGMARATSLRLEAQQALCLAQIEAAARK